MQILQERNMKQPTHKAIHIAKSLKKANRKSQSLSISMSLPTLQIKRKIKHENTTICIVHSTLRDSYDTIHGTLNETSKNHYSNQWFFLPLTYANPIHQHSQTNHYFMARQTGTNGYL